MSAETIANKAFKQGTKALFDYDKHWASCFEPAPFLPMSRAEMDALGWDACDVIIVSGDAYVDHPSFGMAIIGRLLESQGFRVGIIAPARLDEQRRFYDTRQTDHRVGRHRRQYGQHD